MKHVHGFPKGLKILSIGNNDVETIEDIPQQL